MEIKNLWSINTAVVKPGTIACYLAMHKNRVAY